MLMIISPSKKLDEKNNHHKNFTQAALLAEAATLITPLKQMSPLEIQEIMGISDKLARLNFDRFQNWQLPFTLENAKQAVLMFKGDVYTGLDADNLSTHELEFAQQHLGILSGLYGYLKPLDLIQPYRLEMGCNFKALGKKNLYEYWGTMVSEQINSQLKQLKSDTLVNLASNEYYKAVDLKHLNAQTITPVFKDYKNGKYKIISFYAKKARGLMANFAIKNGLQVAEELKQFNYAGYYYAADQSNANELVFLRDQPI